jgi:hypothetical protein
MSQIIGKYYFLRDLNEELNNDEFFAVSKFLSQFI